MFAFKPPTWDIPSTRSSSHRQLALPAQPLTNNTNHPSYNDQRSLHHHKQQQRQQRFSGPHRPAGRVPLNDLPIRSSSVQSYHTESHHHTSRANKKHGGTNDQRRTLIELGTMRSSQTGSVRGSGKEVGSMKVPSVKSSNARLESGLYTNTQSYEVAGSRSLRSRGEGQKENDHERIMYRGIHHLPPVPSVIARDLLPTHRGKQQPHPNPPTSAPALQRLSFQAQQQQPQQQYQPYARPQTSQGFRTSSFRSKIPVIVASTTISLADPHGVRSGAGTEGKPISMKEVKSSRRTSTGSGRYGTPSIANGKSGLSSIKPYYQPLASSHPLDRTEVGRSSHSKVQEANPRPGGGKKISEIMERRISRFEDAYETDEGVEGVAPGAGRDGTLAVPAQGQHAGEDRLPLGSMDNNASTADMPGHTPDGRDIAIGIRTIEHPALKGFAFQEPVGGIATGIYSSKGFAYSGPFAEQHSTQESKVAGSITGKLEKETGNIGGASVRPMTSIPAPVRAVGKTRKSLAGVFGLHTKQATENAKFDQVQIAMPSISSGRMSPHDELMKARYTSIEYIKPTTQSSLGRRPSVLSFQSGQTAKAVDRNGLTHSKATGKTETVRGVEVIGRMEDAFPIGREAVSRAASGRQIPGAALLPAFQMDSGAAIGRGGIERSTRKEAEYTFSPAHDEVDGSATPKAGRDRNLTKKKSSPLLSRMRSAFHLPTERMQKAGKSGPIRPETPVSPPARAGTPTSLGQYQPNALSKVKSSLSLDLLKSRLHDWSHGSSNEGHTAADSSGPRISQDSSDGNTSANTSLDWSFASISTTDLHALLDLQRQERLDPTQEQDGARAMKKKKSLGASSLLGKLLHGRNKEAQEGGRKSPVQRCPTVDRLPRSPPRAPPSEADSLSPMSTPRTIFTASSYSPLAPDNDAFRIHHDALAITVLPKAKLPQLPALHFTRPSHSGSLGLDLQGNGFVSRFGYGLEAEAKVATEESSKPQLDRLPLPKPDDRSGPRSGSGDGNDILSRMPWAKTSSTRPFAGDWEDFSVDLINDALISDAMTAAVDVPQASSRQRPASKRDSGPLPKRQSIQGVFDHSGSTSTSNTAGAQSRLSGQITAGNVSALILEEPSLEIKHKPSLVDIAKMDRANENLQTLLAGIGATPSTMAGTGTQGSSPQDSLISSSDLTNESPTPMRTTAPSHLGRRNMQPAVISPLRISPLRLAIKNSHSLKTAPASSPAGKVFAGRGSVSSTSRKAAKARHRAELNTYVQPDAAMPSERARDTLGSFGSGYQPDSGHVDDAEEVLSISGGLGSCADPQCGLERRESHRSASRPSPSKVPSELIDSFRKTSSSTVSVDDEEAPRTSFDFAGELAGLAGGSRESFLEQLESYGLANSSAESIFGPAASKSEKASPAQVATEHARKFQPKSLFYGFNQNFRFGDTKPALPSVAASGHGHEQQDTSTLSFASISSVGREISSVLKRDTGANVFEADFGNSISLPPIPGHAHRPSAFSSFGNADRMHSSTPVYDGKEAKSGYSTWTARHRPQDSSQDSRYHALSLGRSGLDSEKMFNTDRQRRISETSEEYRDDHAKAQPQALLEDSIFDTTASGEAAADSIFQSRLRHAVSSKTDSILGRSVNAVVRKPSRDDCHSASQKKSLCEQDRWDEGLSEGAEHLAAIGEASSNDVSFERPRAASRTSPTGRTAHKDPQLRPGTGQRPAFTWDSVPALEHTTNSDSERYSTDVQSIMSLTFRGPSGTWGPGRGGPASHDMATLLLNRGDASAERRTDTGYAVVDAFDRGKKAMGANEDAYPENWAGLHRRWDTELIRSTQAYLSSANTIVEMQRFIPPTSLTDIRKFLDISADLYQPMAHTSPRGQVTRRERAETSGQMEQDSPDEGAEDSDGDAVSTIHTAESCTFHSAKKLSLPLPTKFQRADSGVSTKSSLGGTFRTSVDDDGMTPELAAMLARFTKSGGSGENSPVEPSSGAGRQIVRHAVVKPPPHEPVAVDTAEPSHRPRVPSASRRQKLGWNRRRKEEVPPIPRDSLAKLGAKSPKLKKQTSARRLAQDKENVIPRLNRVKTRSERDLNRAYGRPAGPVAQGIRL